jgi:hypothetical protein
MSTGGYEGVALTNTLSLPLLVSTMDAHTDTLLNRFDRDTSFALPLPFEFGVDGGCKEMGVAARMGASRSGSMGSVLSLAVNTSPSSADVSDPAPFILARRVVVVPLDHDTVVGVPSETLLVTGGGGDSTVLQGSSASESGIAVDGSRDCLLL